ncbi:MAG TPA: AraC family transcriptional regulator [Verrucomicrobiales bacterium]|nr:AraC family transcriptional regulator [Verrucomicrobiales bacterium]
MALQIKNISETCVVPPSCRERFLVLTGPAARPLIERGVCFAGVSELHPPYEIVRRRPGFHLLIFTVAGRGVYELAREEGELTAGDLWLAPAGTAQRYRAEGAWSILFFHLDASLPGGSVPQRRALRRPARDLTALRLAVTGYLAETVSRLPGADRAALAQAELIRVYLDREVAAERLEEATGGSAKLERLWEEVALQPGLAWTVEGLAGRYGLSAAQFRRVMLARLGCAPAEMLQRLRLSRAQELLRRTDYSLEEIADQVGYRSPFSLSRAFRRFCGCSPRAYRKPGYA